MTIQRVTQTMISGRSLVNLQLSLGRLAKVQEQLSTGRVINRPSDSPIGTTSAMRLRGSLADHAQYQRNAEDGVGWLATVDQTLTQASELVRQAKELALQGANAATSDSGRAALAQAVTGLREALLTAANTRYLGRPVFGGVTGGPVAYDAAGTYVGTTGTPVQRTVAAGVQVRVDADARAAFGPGGADLFVDLTQLADDLVTGNQAGIRAGVDAMDAGIARITGTLADAGTREARLDRAIQSAKDATLSETQSLTEIENVDLAAATMDLKLQEVAYQAALGATSRVLQPSLLDFLR